MSGSTSDVAVNGYAESALTHAVRGATLGGFRARSFVALEPESDRQPPRVSFQR